MEITKKTKIIKIVRVILSLILAFLLGYLAAEKINFNKPTNDTEKNQNQTSQNENNTIESENQNQKDEEIFSIQYKEEVYEAKIDTGELLATNKRTIPTITNKAKPTIAQKIQDNITKINNNEWDNLVTTSNDIVNEMNSGENEFLEGQLGGLGGTYTMSHLSLENNIITFYGKLEGYFGGVTWYEYKGYNYDKSTGELLTLKTITNNYDALYQIIENEIYTTLNELVENESLELLIDINDKKQLEDLANKSGNWMFTKEGITIIYQKYEIADGASGAISITIDKDLINEYLKEEYQY